MNDAVKKLVKIVEKHSPKMFINANYELIVLPRDNIYMKLDGVESELDAKCKVISWLSRPASKGLTSKNRKIIAAIFNEVLGKDFRQDEIESIYAKFGNSYEMSEIKAFIESGYDLTGIHNN